MFPVEVKEQGETLIQGKYISFGFVVQSCCAKLVSNFYAINFFLQNIKMFMWFVERLRDILILRWPIKVSFEERMSLLVGCKRNK